MGMGSSPFELDPIEIAQSLPTDLGSDDGPFEATSRGERANLPTFAFEHVAAKLVPFDLVLIGQNQRTARNVGQNPLEQLRSTVSGQSPLQKPSSTQGNALSPILQTGGLVFPYNPVINEGVNVNYDRAELVHSNESFYSYKSTENRRINISEAVWTADTFDNAVYMVSVMHFFRSFSFMDFGRGQSGKPPSPMWFSAYGNYAFYKVPVLMEKADWNWPNDIDYVGVPEPGTPEFANRQLQFEKNAAGSYTWVPIKLTVSSISLIVQHSPKYWQNWSLDDYRSGRMLRENQSFHSTRG